MRFVLVFGVAIAILSGAALAQEAQRGVTDPAEQGRYAVQKSDGGTILRVDKNSGATSQCREESSGTWTCQAVAEERRALEDEIGRLASENQRLKQRVAELEKKTGTDPDRPTLELPTKEDMGKVMDFFSDMANRAYEFFNDLQKDFEKQSG